MIFLDNAKTWAQNDWIARTFCVNWVSYWFSLVIAWLNPLKKARPFSFFSQRQEENFNFLCFYVFKTIKNNTLRGGRVDWARDLPNGRSRVPNQLAWPPGSSLLHGAWLVWFTLLCGLRAITQERDLPCAHSKGSGCGFLVNKKRIKKHNHATKDWFQLKQK